MRDLRGDDGVLVRRADDEAFQDISFDRNGMWVDGARNSSLRKLLKIHE